MQLIAFPVFDHFPDLFDIFTEPFLQFHDIRQREFPRFGNGRMADDT
jgi:hypothetical protein